MPSDNTVPSDNPSTDGRPTVGQPAADYPPRADMSLMADLFEEGRRQLSVCNACRYCEGYCPVWPELELRTTLSDGDLGFLANLCHDCQDCYNACMYTAPHEFAVNPPQLFASLREESYRRYAWPGRLPAPLSRIMAGWRGTTLSFCLIVVVVGVLSYAATGRLATAAAGHGGAPYQVLPYPLMLALVGLPALWCVSVLAAGAVRCWRDIHGSLGDLARLRLWPRVAIEAVQLRHMRGTVVAPGGGVADGCDYPGDAPTPARRRCHLALVYGFALCTVSTTSAAIEQDLVGIAPPYPYLSVPVLTGTIGGLAMLGGGFGLLALKVRSDAARATASTRRADYAFLLALLVLAATGLLTLAVRVTPAFGPVLVVHLSAIAVAFAAAPYTKFPHWIYRSLAIYKHRLDGT